MPIDLNLFNYSSAQTQRRWQKPELMEKYRTGDRILAGIFNEQYLKVFGTDAPSVQISVLDDLPPVLYFDWKGILLKLLDLDVAKALRFYYDSQSRLESLLTNHSLQELEPFFKLCSTISGIDASFAGNHFLNSGMDHSQEELRKLEELYPEIAHSYSSTGVHYGTIRGIVISDASFIEKAGTLFAYSKLRDDARVSPPDCSKEWRKQAEAIIVDKARQRYSLNVIRYDDVPLFFGLIDLQPDKRYDEERAIKDILHFKTKKSFKTNEVYKVIPCSAPPKCINAVKAVELLIYGLVGSRDKKNVQASEEFFKEHVSIMARARQYLQTTNGLHKLFYKGYRDNIERIKNGDIIAAKETLSALQYIGQKSKGEGAEALSDIVMIALSFFMKYSNASQLVYKTQSGTIEDIFDDTMLWCCAFHPNGRHKGASTLYTIDPEIALLQLSPQYKNGAYSESIGVAITFFGKDAQGKKCLVVDSIEGGLSMLGSWKEDYYEFTQAFASNNSCDYALYNARVGGTRPKLFNRFLRQKKELAFTEQWIEKIGLTRAIAKYGIRRHFLESFGGWRRPRGIVRGYVLQL